MQDDRTRAAKEAVIYGLLSGYWQLADKLTDRLLASYVDACAEVSLAAVRLVCQRINRGQAGLNSSFPPSPADIATRAEAVDDAQKPAPRLFSGILSMDWGHGIVDMRGLTVDEQDLAIQLSGKSPDGRNLALMTLDEKREALAPSKQLSASDVKAAILTGPRLQRMETEG